MKKHASWTATLLTSLLLTIFIAGCAATATRESTGEYIDDSAITAHVKAAIYDDPDLKIGQISVQTFRGVVQLSGFVNAPTTVAKAGRIAAAVKGVTSVQNDLIVK
jgi:osmotically-inducible protein OsmY